MKLLKILFLSTLIVSALSVVGFAQNTSSVFRMSLSSCADSLLITPEDVFIEYQRDLKDYDVAISMPQDFTAVDLRPAGLFFKGSCSYHNPINASYPVGARSQDESVMILYPNVYFDAANFALRRGNEIESELRTVYRDKDLDVNPLVEIYDVRKKDGFANADTVAIYEFQMKQDLIPAFDAQQFPHCVGVYLRCKDHPALLLKILMSDEAYIRKDEWINTLLNSISYGENGDLRLRAIESDLYEEKTDLGFPSQQKAFKAKPVMDMLED